MPLTRKGSTDFALAKFAGRCHHGPSERCRTCDDQSQGRGQDAGGRRWTSSSSCESPVGEHQVNGAAESAIRSVKDMARTQMICVENQLGARMPHEHALMLLAFTH
eukprot:4487520-Amphidinium_carterae.1